MRETETERKRVNDSTDGEETTTDTFNVAIFFIYFMHPNGFSEDAETEAVRDPYV